MIVGIIGTGTIGTILIESFIESEALQPEQLIIYNRTLERARSIANRYKRIKVAQRNVELVARADLVIVCVKPKDLHEVLQEIAPFLTEQKCLVSVTSPLSANQLDQIVKCSTARIIPSITNRALAGVSLFTIGDNCTDDWSTKLARLFGKISTPVLIQNSQTRVAADITSCGPAFISFLLQKFVQAAVNTGKIDTKTATILMQEMIIGFAELMKQSHYTLESLQEKVTVTGGITGEGIRILEEGITDVFDKVFSATHEKFREDVRNIEIATGENFG